MKANLIAERVSVNAHAVRRIANAIAEGWPINRD